MTKIRLVIMKQAGNAYIEYFVVAMAVLLATIGFYNAHLKQEGSGVRANVAQAFDTLCGKILNENCAPRGF